MLPKLPIPDLIINDIYALTPESLQGWGIELLLLDLDNTLAPYTAMQPNVKLRNWIDSLRHAGIEPFILSNSNGVRASGFSKALSVEYVARAKKPDTRLLFRILAQKGVAPDRAALVGDQIYTDVLCARRAGVLAIAVEPIDLSNPLYRMRYWAELPFREAYRKRAARYEEQTEKSRLNITDKRR